MGLTAAKDKNAPGKALEQIFYDPHPINERHSEYPQYRLYEKSDNYEGLYYSPFDGQAGQYYRPRTEVNEDGEEKYYIDDISSEELRNYKKD